MSRRLARDESGMAMALAVFMVVIVGVMGAGLLVFVNTDLTSAVESNQGQKAFGFADSGAQIAKARLLTTNADFRSYDGTTNLTAEPPNPESPWSCGVWDTVTNHCTAAGRQLNNLDVSPDLDATVWIQYLKPATSPTHLEPPTNQEYAPELAPPGQDNYPVGKDFFKVISWGREGNALRKVEAIYNTYSLGVPKAYYTPGNIRIDGNAGSIRNISLFAGGNVTGTGGQAVAGEDLAYGDWCRSPYNTTQRGTANAGVGAGGTIANRVAGRDFDSTTTPTFVGNFSGAPSPCAPANLRSQITFPFNAGLPDMQALRMAAQTQTGSSPNGSNYYEVTSNTDVVGSGGGIVWPANSLSSTVVYVKSNSVNNTITWKISGNNCNNPSPPVRGTLVIDNGKFTTSPNSTPLRGSIVISGAGPGTEVYTDQGNSCMQSFAVATGDIRIGGNISPATEERGNSPGSYGIALWSWRELYR